MICETAKKITVRGREIHLNVTLPESNPRNYPSVIFLPPAGCHSLIPTSFIQQFVARGFILIGLDYPGHGRSEGPPGHFTLEESVEAVVETARWAKDALSKDIGLLATSMGGFVGCYTLLAQEDLIKKGELKDRYFTSAVLHSLAFSPEDVWAYCRYPLFYKACRKIYIPLVSSISANFFQRFPAFDLRKYRLMFIPLFMKSNPNQRTSWNKIGRVFTWGIDWIKDPLTLSFYTLGSTASLTGTQPPARPEDIDNQVSVKVLISTGDGMVSPEFTKSRFKRIGTTNKELEAVSGSHFFINDQPDMAVKVIDKWFTKTLG